MKQSTHTQRGFTLLELLVAVGIFAVMSMLAYGGLKTVLDARRQTDAQAQRFAAVQLAFTRLARDVEQMTQRGIRDNFGDLQPPLRASTGSDASMEFTRVGWSNPANAPRSRLQRVAYSLHDNQLRRAWWPVLDRAQNTEPVQSVALDNVSNVEWRFMDNDGGWQDHWPLQVAVGKAVTSLPLAVEVTLELEDLGRINRLFLIAVERPVAPTAPTP